MSREKELVDTHKSIDELTAQVDALRQDKENAEASSRVAFDTLQKLVDPKIYNLPGFQKRARVDELALIKPFIRKKSALSDLTNAAHVLRMLGNYGREFDWTCHYFFEPIHRAAAVGGVSTPQYVLFKSIAHEVMKDMAQEDHSFSLPHVEALLYRIARFPKEYNRAFKLLEQKGMTLGKIWPELRSEDANQLYRDELRRRLNMYNSLKPEQRAILALRTHYALDDRILFDKMLAAEAIPNAKRVAEEYVGVSALEREDGDFYPVNLRWYERLPKDLSAFLGAK